MLSGETQFRGSLSLLQFPLQFNGGMDLVLTKRFSQDIYYPFIIVLLSTLTTILSGVCFTHFTDVDRVCLHVNVFVRFIQKAFFKSFHPHAFHSIFPVHKPVVLVMISNKGWNVEIVFA